MESTTVQQILEAALRHHAAGELAQAEALYRRALALRPDDVEAIINLGVALAQQGKHDEAIECQRLAIVLRPTLAEAFNNLAISLLAVGRAEESITAADDVLRARPDYPQAMNNRGNALRRLYRACEAAQSYETALKLVPAYTEARNNYAACLHELGRSDEAIEQYRLAIRTRADFLDARLNLGNLLAELGQVEQAITEFVAAMQSCPNAAGVYNNLGVVLQSVSRLGEAIDAHRAAVKMQPQSAEFHSNLAIALSKQGRIAESLQEYREALRLRPDDTAAHSNLLLAMHFDDRFKPREVFDAHLAWGGAHADKLGGVGRVFANQRDPGKRLKIGYVSSDLREHPVGKFLLPLLEHRDRAAFEVVCYSDNTPGDAVTARLKTIADGWRSTYAMPDDVLAEILRRDGVDILVDLAGHTAHHRLLVFARKPAPIQVSYLGYPDTTGLRTMDYRIVDAISDPPGIGDELHTERLLRLDGPFLCYHHPRAAGAAPSPCGRNDYVTFGSFNNISKISPRTMRTWAMLLAAVPGSRLLLKALTLGDEATCHVLLESLTRYGVPADRVDIARPMAKHADHLDAYTRADIILDTFPYNGTTTTCEALAMGVPVIVLAGQTHLARMGASLLGHAGLAELVAADEAEYIRLAADLANDARRLAELRRTLGRRMAESPLCDGPRVARSIEAVFREIWRRYCGG